MRRFIIYVVVSLCTCVSCHPDFDEVKDTLTNEEVLANSKDTKANQVKVPKVVG